MEVRHSREGPIPAKLAALLGLEERPVLTGAMHLERKGRYWADGSGGPRVVWAGVKTASELKGRRKGMAVVRGTRRRGTRGHAW